MIARLDQRPQGIDPRFIVTSLGGNARHPYRKHHCSRGEAESPIQEAHWDLLFSTRDSYDNALAEIIHLRGPWRTREVSTSSCVGWSATGLNHPNDMAARFGGEECVVLFENRRGTDPAVRRGAAERLHSAVEAHDQEARASQVRDTGQSLAKAHGRLYRAKGTARNGVGNLG